MKVGEVRLVDLLIKSGRLFDVPIYQRNYSWKNKHCKTLFEDIILAGKNNKNHFLG